MLYIHGNVRVGVLISITCLFRGLSNLESLAYVATNNVH